MRIEKIVCDRCGEEVIYPVTRKLYLSGKGREGGFDLCDNCHAELITWFSYKFDVEYYDVEDKTNEIQ